MTAREKVWIQIKDYIRLLIFIAVLSLGNMIYAAIVHPKDLLVIWIDRSFFMGVGAIALFYFGPQNRGRG